jgi:superoxide dismutase, Fe-Mn family
MYEAKDFSALLGTPGFSDEQLNVHFKLYQGYVANTNKVAEKVTALAVSGETGPEYAEMKRRFGWEFDGMRMHEYYFENISKEPTTLATDSALAVALTKEFGSVEAWEKDFRATGALRGIGWAVLAYDRRGDRLFNVWVNEHDAGQLSGAEPIVVMDVFEHAFIFDYGMKRGEYIDAFMKALDYNEASRRFSR